MTKSGPRSKQNRIDARAHQVEVVPDAADLTRVACELVTAAAGIAIGLRGVFRIALSGGSTPLPLYEALATDPYVDWARWQIFWSDERCVPPDDPNSNYGAVKKVLLERLPVAAALVVRMAGEAEPVAAAAAYERAIREMVPPGDRHVTGGLPSFDLILLGMGVDGHTASLFPHTAALSESERLVVANPVPQLGTTRLTFTLPLINAAHRVLGLVSGADKAAALHDAISGPYDPQRLPSQAVHPLHGQLTWLVDEAAFGEIDSSLSAAR